jgi:hypothetical protein
MDMISRDIRNVIYRSNIFPFVSQIYIVSNPEFENDRCSRLSDLFYNRIGISQDMVSFISPTYKHTITDKMMNQNVKNNIIQRLRMLPMKKSEVSLFLNYKAVLESIERNYKDGMFLIFESDIILIQENFLKFNYFLKYIYEKRKSWDIIHIGYSEPQETFGIPVINSKTPYRDDIPERLNIQSFIEDITNEKDSVRLLRKYHTRCTDSFVWNYTGVIKFLEYMNIEPCNTPFDYYMINKFETDENFKHYWTSEPFFIQASNYGLDASTIQNDTS